jgi:hypothetical protein
LPLALAPSAYKRLFILDVNACPVLYTCCVGPSVLHSLTPGVDPFPIKFSHNPLALITVLVIHFEPAFSVRPVAFKLAVVDQTISNQFALAILNTFGKGPLEAVLVAKHLFSESVLLVILPLSLVDVTIY